LDWQGEFSLELRAELQKEIIQKMRAELPKNIRSLPQREEWVEKFWIAPEALTAEGEYSFGQRLYGQRLFEDRKHFESQIRRDFPFLMMKPEEATSPSSAPTQSN
jgi:hypothetical protein